MMNASTTANKVPVTLSNRPSATRVQQQRPVRSAVDKREDDQGHPRSPQDDQDGNPETHARSAIVATASRLGGRSECTEAAGPAGDFASEQQNGASRLVECRRDAFRTGGQGS